MALLKLPETVEHIRQDLQLSAGDANLYVHLLVGGPARVSDLAESLHVHRNDVYRAAERLGTKGLVRTTLERPTRYVADPPERVFDMQIQGRLRAVEALKGARERTRSLMAELQAKAQPHADPSIKVIQGRQEIASAMERLIASAQRSILLLSTLPSHGMLLDLFGTTDVAKRRVEEGLDVRMLLAPSPENRRWAEAFQGHANARVRDLEAACLVRFVLVDEKEICLTVVNDASSSLYAPDEVAIHSLAPGLVQAQRAFFAQCWETAA